MSKIRLLQNVRKYETGAITAADGSCTYRQLSDRAGRIAASLLIDSADLAEARVAFLAPPGADYAASLLGIWQAGGVAVPLSPLHTAGEWRYLLADARVSSIVVHPDYEAKLRPVAHELSVPVTCTSDVLGDLPCGAAVSAAPAGETTAPQCHNLPSRRAMILYTSGTTGRPKGVVTTHGNIQAQIEMLVEAWKWDRSDRILHALPLHHVHGIVNALLCALSVGAHIEFLPRFDAGEVWRRFQAGNVTLFMGVPTMYYRLIAAWEAATADERKWLSESCSSMRLMMSGSAALPVNILEKWKSITGHVLLERYGMTEIGMALSNPLVGERVPGCVGRPLPTVEVRRVDEQGNTVSGETPGEIEVRGPAVFLEYWQRPNETVEAFRGDWFRTGDIAVVENGNYRLLGRKSVDIIKTGGYKVSALEIEEVLRTHPSIQECSVVAVADDQWGECVSVCVVLREGCLLSLKSLRFWAKDRLAIYKIPKRLKTVNDLPRNAMGKVMKPAVAALFEVKRG